MPCYKINENALFLNIKAKTNKNDTKIMEIDSDFIYLAVSAVPDKEKANKQIIKYFENLFKITKTDVTIEFGKHRSEKLIKIKGIFESEKVLQILEATVRK